MWFDSVHLVSLAMASLFANIDVPASAIAADPIETHAADRSKFGKEPSDASAVNAPVKAYLNSNDSEEAKDVKEKLVIAVDKTLKPSDKHTLGMFSLNVCYLAGANGVLVCPNSCYNKPARVFVDATQEETRLTQAIALPERSLDTLDRCFDGFTTRYRRLTDRQICRLLRDPSLATLLLIQRLRFFQRMIKQLENEVATENSRFVQLSRNMQQLEQESTEQKDDRHGTDGECRMDTVQGENEVADDS